MLIRCNSEMGCTVFMIMKKLKDFCDIHGIDFTALEEQWNILGKDN